VLGYDRLGFDSATGGDGVFRQLVLARLVEPTSKLDAIRVLSELGIVPPGYRTIFRRLPPTRLTGGVKPWPPRAPITSVSDRQPSCSTT
jgi:hypothetical protein